MNGYMEDKKFRRLTFDMMLAWELPDAASHPSMDVCIYILHSKQFKNDHNNDDDSDYSHR